MSGRLQVTVASVVAIVGAVGVTAALGGHYSSMNRGWYQELSRPAWQPPDYAFPIAWTTIYALCIASLVLIWNTRPQGAMTYYAMAAFAANAILNVAWSALFFGNRLILPAVYDAALLFLSTVLVMVLAWPVTRIGSLLLAPYALWVAFATVLTARIHQLNP